MKKIFVLKGFIWSILAIFFISCGGDDEVSSEEQLNIDIQLIEQYIADNNILNVQSTSSGLHYVVSTEGTGNTVNNGDFVVAHYEGRLLNGSVFDSSIDRDQPFSFQLGTGTVIAGWDEAFAILREESVAQIILPSGIAYGTTGQGLIPPNAVLIFDVQVLSDEQITAIDEEKIELYITRNQLENVVTTDSGLRYYFEEEGTGNPIIDGNTVTLEYVGYFFSGSIFDQSVNNSLIYVAGEVVQGFGWQNMLGWQEAIPFFKSGTRATIIIPSRLALGRGAGIDGFIPTIEPLLFDIEIINVE